MNAEIKERVEMIQWGEVPKGYKKTKVGIIPEDWEVKRIEEILELKNGINARKEDYGYGIKFINVLDILNNNYINYDNIIGKVNIDGETIKKYCVNYGDILFQRSSETVEEVGYANVYLDKTPATFGGFVIRGKKISNYEPFFLKELLNSDMVRRQIQNKAGGSTRFNVGQKELYKVKICLPPLFEQQKIAQILSTWDEAIELKERLIEEKQEQKKGLMQNLLTGKVRLPGFEGEWEEVRFSKIFNRISAKKHQIKTSEYLNKGLYPVVDQGKEKIIAYSNQEEKVFKVDYKGLIVFGDHTREIKFIDFDFIIGADGTQILQTKEGCDTKFYYYHLLIKRVPDTGYNRHFKFLKEMKFFYPSIQEQKAIADVLSTADREIELLKEEVELLKEQKKGLMQLLLTGIVRVDEAIL